jgi:hypothetical protein
MTIVSNLTKIAGVKTGFYFPAFLRPEHDILLNSQNGLNSRRPSIFPVCLPPFYCDQKIDTLPFEGD